MSNLAFVELQYTSNCTAVRPPFVSQYLPDFSALKKGKPNALHLPFVLQYASHFYGSTSPICTAVLLRKYCLVGSSAPPKKKFSPRPNSPQTPSRPPPPTRWGPPRPLLGFSMKNRPPSPSPAPWAPLSPPPSRKK